MGLGRKRAQRHAGRGETAADVFNGLNFLDGNRVALLQGENLAQRDGSGLFHGMDELLVILPLVRLVDALEADEGVEALEHRGRPGMEFSVAAEAEVTVVGQLAFGREGAGVARQRFLGDVGETEALDLRIRAGEGIGDHVGVNADGLEHLCAAVAGQRGDAHLGHDLEQALFERVAVVLTRRGGIGDLEFTLGEEILQRRDGDVGIDRRGTVAEQTGELMHIAALGGFADDAGLGAQIGAGEVMVHGADREHHGDGRVSGIDVPIAQDDDRSTFLDGLFGLGANAVERGLEAFGAVGDGEAAGDRGGMEGTVLHGEDLLDFRIRQHRGLQAEKPGVLRRFGQPVAVRARKHFHGHDELLTDRIDRRIGHLCEELLEVGVEVARLAGEDGERGVIAHGADGFFARLAHGLDQAGDDGDFFLAVAGGKLLLEQGGTGGGLAVEGRGRDDVLDVLAEPRAIGLLPGVGRLDLVVLQQLAGDGVDGDHFPRPEAALFDHAGVLDIDQADFGAEREETVFSHLVAGGAQTVAIQARADGAAIAEDQGGGAVPRFVEGLVILVEFLHFLRRRRIALPGGGDEHEHGMEDIATAHDEQFQGVIEAGGVAAAGLGDGTQLLDGIAEEVALQFRLAGLGPEAVARHGVDFAVVAHHAQRLGEWPRGERVCAVALVKNSQSCRVVRIA